MPSYAVALARRYDGLFIATFPDVPEAAGFGRDDEEAVEEAAKSLRAALDRREGLGEAMPLPLAPGKLRVEAARSPALSSPP